MNDKIYNIEEETKKLKENIRKEEIKYRFIMTGIVVGISLLIVAIAVAIRVKFGVVI